MKEKFLSKNKNPVVDYFTGAVLDSSENKRKSEYLLHLAAIVESSEDAIISKSLTGIIRSWNKGGEKMFGYRADEVIGKHISLIIPPECGAEEMNILARIRNNEFIDHYETVRNKKNGERVYVSITISPLKDQTGRIIGASKIARDITSRKKSETELSYQNSEKEQRALELVLANKELAFQNEEKERRAGELVIANKELEYQNEEKAKRATELVVVNRQLAMLNENRLKEISDYKHALDESCILAFTDQKGIIKYANNNFCKISKYAFNELIGQDHRIVNSGFHSKDFIRHLWTTISNGKIWKGELKNRAKDGSIYWVDTTIVPFLNQEGKPYQYAAIRADITTRKQVEEELQILNNDLELRVKERTENLESFSYSVSHDLRAPLRAINGYARMFKSGYANQFDTEANRLVNNIVDNAAKMGQLIDDLLTFSRLARREMTGILVPMHEMVTSICSDLVKEQDGRNIKFDIQELPAARADNIGIKQVWRNLISNAIKYSKLQENTIIEIGAEIKEEEIIYYVKDNGVGFDMRYVNKLFIMFQRLHSEEEFEGTGIGLAIVHRIIQKLGGRVWAEGKVDQEAIFYFALKK